MSRDVEYHADATAEYECLTCGETVSGTSHPGECPECGETMRNRGTPLE